MGLFLDKFENEETREGPQFDIAQLLAEFVENQLRSWVHAFLRRNIYPGSVKLWSNSA